MTRNVSNFASDLVTLAELQGKLFVTDFQESKRRLVSPAVLLVGGLVLLLASLPVALIGLAEVFQPRLPRAGAYFLAAGIGAVAALILVFAGWKLLSGAFQVYRRSTSELDRNVQWLKTALTSRSTQFDSNPWED